MVKKEELEEEEDGIARSQDVVEGREIVMKECTWECYVSLYLQARLPPIPVLIKTGGW